MRKFNLEIFLGFILIPLLSLKTKGQTDTSMHKNYAFVQINAGMGIPIGGYFFSALNNLSTNPYVSSIQSHDWDAGETTNGYNINLTVGYPIQRSHWGIMALFDIGANKYPNYSPYIGTYKEYVLMVGPFLSLPVKKTLFDFRVLAGPSYFIYPGMSYVLTIMGSLGAGGGFSGKWDISNNNSISSIAYDFGFSLKHSLNRKLIFSINVDALLSQKESSINQNIQFTDYYNPFPTGGQVTNVSNIYSLDIFLLNISVGLGYWIGK